MPREKLDLEKVSVRLYKGDKDELTELYHPDLGYNEVIRKLVRGHIRKKRQRQAELTAAALDAIV